VSECQTRLCKRYRDAVPRLGVHTAKRRLENEKDFKEEPQECGKVGKTALEAGKPELNVLPK